MEITRPPRPGHPPADIAWRLRNWVWYWTVKRVSGLSDERLDALYLPESQAGARRRFFQRLRSLGSDPTIGRADLGGGSVFQQVHAPDQAPELRVAEQNFRSALWDMLVRPRWGIEDHRQLIDQIIAERGWYRSRTEDRSIAGAFLQGDPTFGYAPGREHVYAAMLTYLESHPTADHVALLAALFREAMTEVALAEAEWLRVSLLTCVRNWLNALRMPAPQLTLLLLLIAQRLVHGWWFTPNISLKAHGSQRRYVQALVEAHLATSPTGMTESYARHPIVLRSPRVAWINAHRAALEPIANTIHGPVAVGVQSADVSIEQTSTLAGLARSHIERWLDGEKARQKHMTGAQSMVEPPPMDMRYCLPVEPGTQRAALPCIGDTSLSGRPLPYLADGHLDTPAGRRERLAPKSLWSWDDPPRPLRPDDSNEGS